MKMKRFTLVNQIPVSGKILKGQRLALNGLRVSDADAGRVVIVATISPYRDDRVNKRERFAPGRFVEVIVNADLDTCASHDTKSRYRRARSAELQFMTGSGDPDEAPLQCDTPINSVNGLSACNASRLWSFHVSLPTY